MMLNISSAAKKAPVAGKVNKTDLKKQKYSMKMKHFTSKGKSSSKPIFQSSEKSAQSQMFQMVDTASKKTNNNNSIIHN